MKCLTISLVLLILLANSGCIFLYTEKTPYSQVTVLTTGNIGFTTDKIGEGSTNINSIPLLGGNYKNDILTDAEAVTGGVLTAGTMSVGIVDNSTPLDTGLMGVWYNFRSWLVKEGITDIAGKFYGHENAKVAADSSVKQAEIANETQRVIDTNSVEKLNITTGSAEELARINAQ